MIHICGHTDTNINKTGLSRLGLQELQLAQEELKWLEQVATIPECMRCYGIFIDNDEEQVYLAIELCHGSLSACLQDKSYTFTDGAGQPTELANQGQHSIALHLTHPPWAL